MKPVFKCDYCSKMGTEDEIKEHESVCMDNYDRRSCYTCIHKKHMFNRKNETVFECKAGNVIPEGKLFEFCDKYERLEKPKLGFNNIFGNFIGF